METKVAALFLIALIVGVGIGYGIRAATAPAPAATPAPGATATVTVTKTVTKTAPAAPAKGLTGKIKIGALLALTGELSTYGENSKAALELAVSEINKWLKERGEDWEIELIIEDTATDPKTCFDKIQILYGRGVRIVIGPMTSAEVSEVKKYADANKILVIAPSSTSPALSIPGDWIYRYCPDDTIQGPAAARTLLVLGARWVVPVWRGDTWGDGVKRETEEVFKKMLEKAGMEGGFVEGIRYAPGTKEFSAEAAKLNEIVSGLVEKYGADKVGIYYVGFEEAVAFVLACKEYDVLWKVAWVGTDGTAQLAPLAETPEVAEFGWKVKWLHPVFAVAANPIYEKVKNYIIQKLGREPDPYAYASYDGLWSVAIALETLDEYDPEKIKAILPSILEHYAGASGMVILNENGDRAFSDYNLWIVREVSPGKYEWALAGVWHFATDSVTWEEWFSEYAPK